MYPESEFPGVMKKKDCGLAACSGQSWVPSTWMKWPEAYSESMGCTCASLSSLRLQLLISVERDCKTYSSSCPFGVLFQIILSQIYIFARWQKYLGKPPVTWNLTECGSFCCFLQSFGGMAVMQVFCLSRKSSRSARTVCRVRGQCLLFYILLLSGITDVIGCCCFAGQWREVFPGSQALFWKLNLADSGGWVLHLARRFHI